MIKVCRKIIVACLSLVCLSSVFTGCAIQKAEPEIPQTDLATTYTGEVKDDNGNLLVPFDVAYPEAFASGEYKYDERTLLIKTPHGKASLSRSLKQCGIASIEKFSSAEDGDWCRAGLKKDADIHTAIQKVRSLSEVLMADYDYIYEAEATDAAADPAETESLNDLIDDVLGNVQVQDQWYLTSSEIQRSWRWLKANGSQAGGLGSVTVAVIDTGVDYTHPDLKANMWVNQGEIPGNGIDDDGNGYIDDIYGCNTIANNGGAQGEAGDPMDDHGHGTHVAGIIGAANNREGIVGVAYNTKIMAVKAGQATGVFLQSDVAEAILYAYEMGADVINMSFGGSACSIAVQDALTTAYTRSTLVASAGNDGKPNEKTDYYKEYGEYLPNYPAALSYVIGVMSVGPLGVESGFTNWDATAFNGVEYEMYAPGEAIMSTLPGGRYGKLSGTSMAAPVVSGAAALLRSYYIDRDMYPSKFIAAQLSATSGDEAICCNPEKHTVNGSPHNLPMRLNVYDALTKVPTPDVELYDWYMFDSESISESNNGDGVADAGEIIEIGAVLRNRWGMSKDTVVTIDAIGSGGIANPYVEILTASSNFEGVGTYSQKDTLLRDPNGKITGAENPLKIRIAENCPNDYLIRLNVTVTCGNGLDDKDGETYITTGMIEFWVRNGVVLMGQINEDQIWTKDNYYIIPSSLYIAEGVTVTVEPGTQIQFWSDDPEDPYADSYIAYLQVAGNFIVNGTEEEPVSMFPSEMMGQYEVKFFEEGNGCIELNYTKITNANMIISKADHCYFTQNYIGRILGKKFSDGAVVTSEVAYSNQDIVFDGLFIAGAYTIQHATNSIFYKLNSDSLSYTPNLAGNYIKCAFVDCAISYGHNIANYKLGVALTDCVFSGNNVVNGENIYVSTYKLYKSFYDFTGNVILNNLNDANVEHWLRIQSYSGATSTRDLSGNYWGTTDIEMIERQIVDFDDYSHLGDIIVGEYLTTPPENTFPFVTDAYLLNSNGERSRTVGNERVTFVVEFNRDMDTSMPLRVRFGAAKPYADYEVEGNFVSARRWEGTYTLKTTIENGNQVINVENGRAADDHWLILCESAGRFQFEIDTTAAQAMIMQAEATETGIKLTWMQDDFDTIAGYNVYRSESEDGFYQRLNDYVLSADTTEFFDDTVEPGKRYYYNFTVVKTDLSESTPSGKVNVMSFDTMAPDIYHSPVRTAYTGSNLVVGATITDNLQITEAKLWYRSVGGEWKFTVMTANNSRYSGIISAQELSLNGLEYYIDAFDGVNHTYKGTAENPYVVTVKQAVDKNSLGDVDGDGVITIKDALMLLQAANDLLNLTEEQFLRADINGDKTLSAAEALLILQYVSGKITTITA